MRDVQRKRVGLKSNMFKRKRIKKEEGIKLPEIIKTVVVEMMQGNSQ